MEQFLKDIKPLYLDSINGLGANMATSFVELANNKNLKPVSIDGLNLTLINFFNELKRTGAEFGYRSASEIHRFVAVANHLDPEWKIDDIIDCAIMQKLLPKVHGSRRKLEPVLKTLGALCLKDGKTINDIFNRKPEIDVDYTSISKYPISFEKIDRMYKRLTENGFTSYAEA
jgi:5-methylcytosine-specific restriction protein B